MAEAFIKLYRKLLKWEWYDDPNTCRVFIHCLLKANWKEARWHGVEIQPGQFITSLPKLAKETKLSIQQTRTALSKLVSTGEITDKGYSKFRIITVNNWSQYQGATDKITDNQQTNNSQSNRQVTAVKEYKEDKNIKNKKIHNFSERKVDYEELEEIAKSDQG